MPYPSVGVLPTVWPDLAAFRSLAAQYNLIPICRLELGDIQTPVGLLLRFRTAPRLFLLESAEGNEQVGRYSFLGPGGSEWLEARGGGLFRCREGSAELLSRGDPLEGIRAWLRQFRPAPLPGLPPFSGGLVGWFGYDLARPWVGLQPRPDGATPHLRLMVADRLLAFDHFHRTLLGVVHIHLRPGDDPDRRYGEGLALLEELLNGSQGPSPGDGPPILPQPTAPESAPVQPLAAGGSGLLPEGWAGNLDQGAFEAAVRQAQAAIGTGEVAQVVLSQAFRRPLRTDPLHVYRILRSLNPSPYLFYLRVNEETLLGSSPEMMARLRGDVAEVRPIAGTRPRGRDDEEDRRLEEELLADAKEEAEHAMLVDLGRQELAEVAQPGSIQVGRLKAVERFSHVMHLVSALVARLRPGLDGLHLLRAVFPAGTVTGVPKARAMQLIDRLEPEPRGLYAGAVGYLDFRGNVDSCIAIRSLHVAHGVARVQVGAGIVAQSDPAREYQETLNKARALFAAVAQAEGEGNGAAPPGAAGVAKGPAARQGER
ncbi:MULTISPECIES: anthranilate synthase component I family protein [Limnochorda]|uniref:anthranilate synthase component I family protein n=1 Tax=Limnochorda TaxID=1676651 RepID=UPI00182AC17C|nr:anthranilate synthase component I family protein [Limnochorda pilosa]MBO2485954.1 anthranilate synthase component I [Bacillota bacterium]MBO2518881.1 anthranilate synthase component I [Bacillota bacterium]NMA70984.1 anthranilate synthase component I family protein [Bacillota bacterium]